MKNHKGQNIVEYILMAVAVILVMLVILNPKSGPLKHSVERTLNSTTNQLDKLSTGTSSIRF
jgi:hypothetical protein